jgi:hypothetical protein
MIAEKELILEKDYFRSQVVTAVQTWRQSEVKEDASFSYCIQGSTYTYVGKTPHPVPPYLLNGRRGITSLCHLG